MPSQSNPNAAAGDMSPGLAPLAPPAGAYFGRLLLPAYSNATTLNYPFTIEGNPPSGDIVQQSVSEVFVYWINGASATKGTTGTPGYYLIIQRQTFVVSSTASLATGGYMGGWFLSSAYTGTALNTPPPGGALNLVATSPNSGDPYANVRQGMTLNVFLSGGSPASRYVEVTDQATWNLPPGWAVLNKQFLNWYTLGHDMNTAYWVFRQTTPWDPLVRPGGVAAPNNDPWSKVAFDDNDTILPIPDISRSSLTATTYATWMVTNPAWTQDAPPTCTVTGLTTMGGNVYLLLWFNGAGTYWGNALDVATNSYSLALDQIVQLIPAAL